MGDLSPFVAQQSQTVQRIYDAHKARGDAEPQRGYLGASIVGHECARYLWYTFRGAVREDVDGRIYRLFERGDLEESRMVADLRAIGCEVLDRDPQTGEQFEVSSLGGHFSGHMDAAVLGVPEAPKTWHVGEFKTANAKNFAKIQKEGVRSAKPIHWAQMQVYMGLTGMTRALYVVCNKDTDELYAERVRFDSAAYKTLMARAARIIRTSQAPERVASRPDDWRCKFCPAHALCWGAADAKVAVPLPGLSCKSCCHSTPETEGEGARWSCARYQTDLEDTGDGARCPTHLMLPGLISFAEPVDADEDWIEFKSEDGTVWRHGQGEGSYTSAELIAGRGPLDQGAAVDFADLPLVARFPWAESEKIWDGPAAEIADAITEYLGVERPSELLRHETERQVDEQVNAAAYKLEHGDYLVVFYRQDDHAAIWKGKA